MSSSFLLFLSDLWTKAGEWIARISTQDFGIPHSEMRVILHLPVCESRSVVFDSWWLQAVHGTLQARILEWGAVPFSRGSSQSRDRTQVSHVAGRFFTSWTITREVAHLPIVAPIIFFFFLGAFDYHAISGYGLVFIHPATISVQSFSLKSHSFLTFCKILAYFSCILPVYRTVPLELIWDVLNLLPSLSSMSFNFLLIFSKFLS